VAELVVGLLGFALTALVYVGFPVIETNLKSNCHFGKVGAFAKDNGQLTKDDGGKAGGNCSTWNI
jgi:hypothetical protein